MITRPQRLILPEIAERYGRTVNTIRTTWTTRPDWPQPAGRRGRWLEYDAKAVDQAVKQITGRQPLTGGRDSDLLDVAQAAAWTGLSEATIRADLSRGRWPQPDDTSNGVNRWKRKTIRGHMRGRRAYHRHTQKGTRNGTQDQ